MKTNPTIFYVIGILMYGGGIILLPNLEKITYIDALGITASIMGAGMLMYLIGYQMAYDERQCRKEQK